MLYFLPFWIHFPTYLKVFQDGFNFCYSLILFLATGDLVPSDWGRASVVPVFQKGRKYTVGD